MSLTSYRDVQIKTQKIVDCIACFGPELDKLNKAGMEVDGKVLETIKNNLSQSKFKVLVIGEFKNGKSTVINALLGEKILPAYSTPCTAVINEIIYGDEVKATLFFKNPLPENVTQDIEPRAKIHISKYENSGEIPPYEIDIDDLTPYVAISNPEVSQSKAIAESPYSKVVLEYPSPLCRDGIELIDSPGLNENETRTKITNEYLTEADAIIFVFRCPKIGSKDELSYINNKIRQLGHEDIFFLCNGINEIVMNQREHFINDSTERLLPLTSLKERGIFFVNALGALNAKRNHDKESLNVTGMPEFEITLSEYLRNNKAKTKLLHIVTTLLNFSESQIEQCLNNIEMMKQDAVTSAKYEKEAKPLLDAALVRKENIEGKFDLAITKFKQEMKVLICEQYSEIAKRIPAYVNDLQVKNEISFNPFTQDSQRKALQEELCDEIDHFIQDEMGKWIQTKVQAYIQNFMSGVAGDVEADINNFYDNLKDFHYKVTGVKTTSDISNMERISATILGTIACGPAYGLLGASLGLKEVLMRSAATLGIMMAALSIVPLSQPFVFAAIVGSGLFQLLGSGESRTKKCKDELAQNFIACLNKEKENASKTYAEKLTIDLRHIFELIGKALAKEVDVAEKNLASIQENKLKQGKDNGEKIDMLTGVVKHIALIKQELTNIKQTVE